MVSLTTWVRYIACKFDYSISVGRMAYLKGHVPDSEILDAIWRNLLQGKLTYLHCNKGEDKAPMTGDLGETILVRKIPSADSMRVDVKDVVVLKDPINKGNYLVRRLAAVEGDEMLSTDKDDEPFVLEKDQCWVLADNQDLKPKEAYDSRTFGPVTMADIVGRAIYSLRSMMDHGPVNNSERSTRQDSPVLEVELDVDEMAKDHKV